MSHKCFRFLCCMVVVGGVSLLARAWQTPTTAQPVAVSTRMAEKIVFVRADPSLGVQSIQSVTDLDGFSGNITGAHDAPQFRATSASNPKTSEIALMNPDGSGVTQIHVFGSDPSLSPDGKRIAFCSIRESQYAQIYVMNADGKEAKRLTSFESDAGGPVWSHDGKKIAFYAFAQKDPRRNPQIWVMDADGSNQKRITEHGLDPAWSNNDSQIVFASNRADNVFQIYVMNADGSNVKRLTKHKAEDSSPAWAPDGAAIVYSSESEGDRRGLFMMGADGSDPHGLAHSKHQDFCFPAWSLDGRTIAFTALNRLGPQAIVVGEDRPRCEVWSGEYQIFTMDSEGKIHQISDAKLMGMRPSYGRVASQ